MGAYNNKTDKMQRYIYVWIGHTIRETHDRTTREGQNYTDFDWRLTYTKTGKPRFMPNKFDHTIRTDRETGKPIEMIKVYLPKGTYNFPKDSNGYDRNNRKAYIQVPYNVFKKSKVYSDYRLIILNRNPIFTVYFENRQETYINGKAIWQPNVESIKVTFEDLMEFFEAPWVTKKRMMKKQKKMKPKHITKKTIKKKAKEVQVSEKTSKSKQMLNNLKNRTSDFSQDKGRENALER